MHKFDAQLKWNNDCYGLNGFKALCSNFKILESLPVYCEEGHSCLDVIDSSEIVCSTDDVPLPQIEPEPTTTSIPNSTFSQVELTTTVHNEVCLGCFGQEDIDNLQNSSILKSLAIQAIVPQMALIVPNVANQEDKCGVNLVSVGNFQSQVLLDLSVFFSCLSLNILFYIVLIQLVVIKWRLGFVYEL